MEVFDLQMCECYYGLIEDLLKHKTTKMEPCTYGNNCFMYNQIEHPNAMKTLCVLARYDKVKMAINRRKILRSSL